MKTTIMHNGREKSGETFATPTKDGLWTVTANYFDGAVKVRAESEAEAVGKVVDRVQRAVDGGFAPSAFDEKGLDA